MIATIASQQIQALRRQNLFVALLGVLMAMTSLSGVIGWSSHRTILRVYNDATQLLAAEGKGAPPNPFDRTPTLSMLSNMSIYIPLIGALVALIVGHLAVADDQATGVGRMIFSRPISRARYIAGKILGAAVTLAAVLVASVAISSLSLLIVNRALSGSDFGRLVGFYSLSWLYLMVFALVGMVAGLMARKRSLALLGAMGVWLIFTFVVPQFTSGLRPTASLNPISDPAGISQRFFQWTAHARPLSISEQYKDAGASILGTTASTSTADTLSKALILALFVGALALAAAWLVGTYDYSRSSSGE